MQFEIRLRRGQLEDAPELGRICYDAFHAISSKHGFPCYVPSIEVATDVLRDFLCHPQFYSVVAESNGKIIGSNFLDERAIITGGGPVSVEPTYQNSRVGRELNLAIMRRSTEIGAAGIRGVVAAHDTKMFALLVKLGWEPKELLTNFHGTPPWKKMDGREVRRAIEEDLSACNRLCEAVYDFNRSGELADSIKRNTALVVEHDGRITGYSTALASFGHSVGESNEDLMALMSHVDSFDGIGSLVPARNHALLKWCLENGLRISQQMILMTIGLYNEPHGAYLPSVAF